MASLHRTVLPLQRREYCRDIQEGCAPELAEGLGFPLFWDGDSHCSLPLGWDAPLGPGDFNEGP